MSERELKKSLESYIKTVNAELLSLRHESACKDVLIEMFNTLQSEKTNDNKLFTLIYTHDNGEGANTEDFVGVFTLLSKALKAKHKIMKDYKYSSSELLIQEFEFMYLIQNKTCDICIVEDIFHGESYNTIVGLKNGSQYDEKFNQNYYKDGKFNEIKNFYTKTVLLDKVYTEHIEE